VAKKVRIRKCLICEVRPAFERGFCKHCLAQLEADKKRNRQPKVYRYITYRGVTFAFRKNGGDKFTAELLKRDPATLPQRLLINLDTYCPGFERKQIQKMKRLCLSAMKN
jgi:hypothetical protein